MRMKRVLLQWAVISSAALIAVGCVPMDDSPSTGPNSVPAPSAPSTPAPTPAPAPAPAPAPFVRYVAVSLDTGFEISGSWGIAYGSNQQGTRNAANDYCQRNAPSCSVQAECRISGQQATYAALAMTNFSSTFPVGRNIALSCAHFTAAEAEQNALRLCTTHPKTGACRIHWSGSVR